MSRIVFASDFHFSDKAPARRKDDYFESLLLKLDQIRQVCVKVEAVAMVLPGDLFHVNESWRNSHWMTNVLIRAFRRFPCPVLAIAGNHDLPRSGNPDLVHNQPLGVLYSSKALLDLDAMGAEGIRVAGEKSIRVVGCSYGRDYLEFLEGLEKGDEDLLVCALHVYASRRASSFFGEPIHGFSEFEDYAPDVFLFGHYHANQGVVESGGKLFCCVGSVARGSLSEDSMDHVPRCGVLSCGKEVKAQGVNLKVASLEEAFDVDTWKQEKKNRKEIEQFVENLAVEAISSESDDFAEMLGGMNLPDEVGRRCLRYLEEASIG